ncbi:2-hydroxyacid dehydrogenase [Asticcacaulis sp. SL142]|uniref:2-hydroxyacid dehydrogenase n=1 Tax=Asticcacaulis sp. SL142 TaxID=2995155 RepID=UPI00226C6E1A|nr:2-hydroxyacid dehydrogenase [Asticcacaulis sp. SL142]WAC48860.1 2-hydroxyacid dehydrogenase [Asticcacaulis sp. SL142]
MSEAFILLSSPPTIFVQDEIRGFADKVIDPWASEAPQSTIESKAHSVRAIINCNSRLSINAEYMQSFPKLEFIASHGVGYDNIDAVWAAQNGIMVTNTPDVLTEDVADLAMGLLLSTVRMVPQADRFVRSGGWRKGPFPLSASLQGRRIGIVGLGRIGRAIARRAEAFDIAISYHGRQRQAHVDYDYYADLLSMAKDCDILIVAAPATPLTRHIINAEVLKALGPTGVLINVSRGSLVDEDALIQTLTSGTISAAGLDVYEDEPNVSATLIDLQNVVLLPHIGSATTNTRKAMAQLVAANVRAWLSGHDPLTPVPECSGF